MIKKLFNGQINSITMAALLVALSSLVSRFLGIFRDRILAGSFGAGDTLDIYYAAFRIPDLIFNLLVLGALSAGFIPIFTCLIRDPNCKLRSIFSNSANKDAWVLANNVLNIMMLFLIFLSTLGMIFAPQITKLITPGFFGEKQIMTANLTRIMFLSPIFLGISSILGGILQSFKRFFVYSLSPILYNVGIIIGALFFVPKFGIYGLAWGVVFGAFLHMMVQLPAVIGLGFKYIPVINFKDSNVRKIGTMMIARTMSLAISQINLTILTIIASTLASGSLAVFNLANNLQSFPVGIFGISFAIAAFPTFSAVAFDKKKLVSNFSRVLRQVLFFIIPSMIVLFFLRAQIIRVILGTGQFNWEDTNLTMNTLSLFLVSLFAQAILPLITRAFYARHDSKTPFLVGIFSSIVNIVLSIYFSRKIGVAGLALGFSIENILNLAILWVILKWEIGALDEKRILISVLKFCVAALACAISIQGMKLLVWPYIDMTKTLGVLAQGLTAGIVGISTYIAFCSLMGSEELLSFWDSIKRRLSWKKVDTDDQGEARGI